MRLHITKNGFVQYITIYLMLLINSTNFYELVFRTSDIYLYAAVGILLLIALIKYRKHFTDTFIYIAFLLGFVFFERILNGGIGLAFWAEITLKILITYVAISIDKKKFITRFIYTVSILAAISLFFWGLQLLGLNIAKLILPRFNSSYTKNYYDYQGFKTSVRIPGYGMFLYSFNEFYFERNIGIFYEPGVYQMVLNAAIFCLIFFEDYHEIDAKRRKSLFLLLCITLVSTQSTSGYIGLAAIVLGIILRKEPSSQRSGRWKRYVAITLLLGLLVVFVDHALRGTGSLLYVAIISKLFTDSGEFSVVAENSTGLCRLVSTYASFVAMVQHPFGLGCDNWGVFRSAFPYQDSGGWPFKFGAMVGVIPFLHLLHWLFKPLRYLKGKAVTIAVFLFLYFNTEIAQSSPVYPTLIMIPLFLTVLHGETVFQPQEFPDRRERSLQAMKRMERIG